MAVEDPRFMPVDVDSGSDGDRPPVARDEALAAADGLAAPIVEPRRPSALRRVAGTAPPEGSEVDRSLEAFIAQAYSTEVDMTGWRLSDERAGRVEPEREARPLARSSSRQPALEAALDESEVRAMAEERTRTGPRAAVGDDRAARVRTQRVRPLRRRRSAAAPILLAAGIVVVGVALSLVLARTGRSRGEAGVSPGAAREMDGASAPEPVVRPMLPAEPAVTPLAEPGAAEKSAPVKARPVVEQQR